VQKTDVRVIAATNKDLYESTQNGKFREDLYYRLSTVPIRVPPLRDRKEDIPLLFRKFVVDFAERYKTMPVQLDDEAKNLLINYTWPGNVRELKNIAEQISVLSTESIVTVNEFRKFLPEKNMNRMPVLASSVHHANGEFANEREILYKLFFDMKKDVTELKKMFVEVMKNPSLAANATNFNAESMHDYNGNGEQHHNMPPAVYQPSLIQPVQQGAHHSVIIGEDEIQQHEEVEETLNIMDKEKELIIKALKKHKGKRKDAALDLGISERTLYRKLKEYDINE
jgi:DNA-binding NtrC family response regulator